MKVKVIKVEDKNYSDAIGKTFEAIKVKLKDLLENDSYYYVMPCEEYGWWCLPEESCIVIDEDFITTVDNQIIKKENILLVEDGSVDTDQLEQDGFYLITYRNGSQPPMWLK